MANKAIETHELRVSLGKRVVLDHVDFSAEAGKITAVLGPNGAGKTTLLKTIAGFLHHEGTVFVEGERLERLSRITRAKRIAYVPQRSLLASGFPVEIVVSQGRYAFGDGRQKSRARVAEALRRADVSHLARRPFTQLSEGERRRVLIARALATGARIILLDEPTSALDIGHVLKLFDLLRELSDEDYALIVVVHSLDDAARFTDDAVLLDRGRVACKGKSSEVISEVPVRQIYGVEMLKGAGLSFRLATP